MGADTFFFEDVSAFNNIDVVYDFSTAENDALDISDILSGLGVTSGNITDYVRITNSAGDSDVRVDVTGSGTFGAATKIATLFGVTGLTDEAALVTNGDLIV